MPSAARPSPTYDPRAQKSARDSTLLKLLLEYADSSCDRMVARPLFSGSAMLMQPVVSAISKDQTQTGFKVGDYFVLIDDTHRRIHPRTSGRQSAQWTAQ